VSHPVPRSGLPALPPGYGWASAEGALAAVDLGAEEALRAIGLLEPARVADWLAAAHGHGGRAPIAVVQLPDRSAAVALRGLHRGGWLGPLLGRNVLDVARPFRELAVTARLRAAGAPVPRPLLALAWRGGLAWHTAVGTAFEPGAVDAATFLAGRPSHAARIHAITAAGRAVRRFHDSGGSHPDLHVGNLLVRAGDPPEVLVVDLDGARIPGLVGPDLRMAQLMRLYRSLRKRGLLEAAGGDRGGAAFFRAYVAGDRTLRRSLLARLPAERRRVARHAWLYRRA
jgi:hypothetical protein